MMQGRVVLEDRHFKKTRGAARTNPEKRSKSGKNMLKQSNNKRLEIKKSKAQQGEEKR